MAERIRREDVFLRGADGQAGGGNFLAPAAELRVDPGCALFLDDKPPNIDGARQAGMQAFLFDAPEKQGELERLLLEKGILLPELDEAVTTPR